MPDLVVPKDLNGKGILTSIIINNIAVDWTGACFEELGRAEPNFHLKNNWLVS